MITEGNKQKRQSRIDPALSLPQCNSFTSLRTSSSHIPLAQVIQPLRGAWRWVQRRVWLSWKRPGRLKNPRLERLWSGLIASSFDCLPYSKKLNVVIGWFGVVLVSIAHFEGTPLRLLLIRICSFQNGNDRVLTLSSHFFPGPSSADILPFFSRLPTVFQQSNGVDTLFFEEKYCIFFGAIDCDLKGRITRQTPKLASTGSSLQEKNLGPNLNSTNWSLGAEHTGQTSGQTPSDT